MHDNIKYSHRSNGNSQSQSSRTGGGSSPQYIRNSNEPTGEASQQNLLDAGVSSREPFDRQMGDYEIYPEL